MKKAFSALGGSLTLRYVLLAALPMLLVLWVNMRSYTDMMQSEVSSTVLQLLRQASINIDNDLATARRISDSLFMNEDVNDFLSASPRQQTLAQQWEELHRLRRLLDTAYQSPTIVGARLFVPDEKAYANERINLFPFSSFAQEPAFAHAMAKPSFTDTYVQTPMGGAPQRVISCIRYIRNLSRINQTIGALAIDIREEDIAALLRGINLPWEHSICLLNEVGTLISSDVPPDQPDASAALLPRLPEGIYTQEATLYVVTDVGDTGWQLVAQVPWSQVRAGFFSNRTNTLVLILGALAVVLVFTVLSSRMISKVVRRMNELVLVFADQPVPQAVPARASTRWLGIHRQLDEAIDKAKRLLQALYEQMELQRSTQLKLLQAQINPHFLYNALDTVNWMVRAGHSDRAVTMITTLTRYLRLILNNGQDTVAVADEVSLAQAYLDIQRLRFGDSFDVDIIVDDSAAGCLLPKLTLQPIIENALTHGIQSLTERRGRIDVDIYAEEDRLVLSVTDNGVGMDEDTTRKLLEAPTAGGSGYGLYSVHQRTLLFSGNAQYGLTVESEPDKYTSVTLHIAQRRA